MRRMLRRHVCICKLLVASLLLGGGISASLSAEQASVGDVGELEDVFQLGPILQDRNGDGAIDFVAVRVILGDTATSSDVVAAASVAARLGFETMAMDLPLGADSPEDQTAIVIGMAGVNQAGLSTASIGLESLKPGEGVVALTHLEGKPALLITGRDDAGTRAAAEVFAGRMPHVWDLNGPTLETVATDVRDFLISAGVEVREVSVPVVHAMSGSTALERVVVAAQVSSEAHVARAQGALRPLVRRAKGKRVSGNEEQDEAPLSYCGLRVIRLRISAPGTRPVDVDIPQADPPTGGGPLERRPGTGPKQGLDLSGLYGIEGFLGDSDNNLIPDRVDVILSPAGEGIRGTVDLAARMGLESTGISVPIAKVAGELGPLESEPALVLIGTSHPLVERLIEEGKVEERTLQPGEGLIQVVRKAFGDTSALVITGGDARGVERALSQVAERFPHIWERGKDRTTLDDVEEEVRRFLSGRSPAGQAAMALYKLDRISAQLEGRDLEEAHVKVFVEKAPEGFSEFVRREAEGKIDASSLDVIVESRDVQGAKLIFDDEFEIPSEVDEFWRLFRTRVIRSLKKNRPVVMEVRLNEPPDIRAQLEREARAALIEAGVAEGGTSVNVLSAYKQGYSWLHDVVRPALVGKAVEQITIRFAEIGPPPEWPHQAMYTPTRWLLELRPIDEVLARELRLDLKQIRFQKMPIGSPTYEVIVTGKDGGEILRQTFEPKFVLRSYFDLFPNYEKVRVTTGWITATVAGKRVVDQRIITDVERFWDHYQGKTLPAIYDYVMELHEGKPRNEGVPHFGEFVVDLTLSEPDYQVGVDKARISTLEAIHEELYLSALHFFDLLGRFAHGQELTYPGRVIPVMRSKADGKPGRAKITFTGFSTNRPMVVVTYRERGGRLESLKLAIPRIAVARPVALSAVVRDGREGLERLWLRVKVDSDKDHRAEWVRRTRAEEVDREIISAEQVMAVVANLGRLRAAGLYRNALAYHHMRGLSIVAGWEHEVEQATQRVARLENNGSPAPFPDIRALLPSGYRYEGKEIVQWNTPIPPGEAYEMLAKMSTFKEAKVYKVGESYLGKDIWAMDLMPPVEASHWSQAKATTLKPSIVYSGRQHANEVSSTSHILKLAELMVVDPEFKQKLSKVNVVIHPILNPDGAQLAYDLYKITPDYLLHAGYLGALGEDVTSGQWEPDPVYPESTVRPKIWRTWLPDIFLNPHGYISHECVQIFGEYAGWVRNRIRGLSDWWGTRGWFLPSFRYLDDPKYPRHKEAAFTIREMITEYINAAPEVRALNQRAYDQHRRYGFAHDTEHFKLDFFNDVLVYSAIKGETADPTSRDFMSRHPNVTIWTGSTEAPDETAYGDWMKLVATAGLQWDKAVLQYLVEGDHVVERTRNAFSGGVSLALHRARPPKARKDRETMNVGEARN